MANGMPIPPQPQSEQPQPQSGGSPGGSPKELVSGIHSQMLALAEILDQSPGVSDQDKSQLSDIINQFQMFVSSQLGASSSPSPQPGNVPPESAGNENARPV